MRLISIYYTLLKSYRLAHDDIMISYVDNYIYAIMISEYMGQINNPDEEKNHSSIQERKKIRNIILLLDDIVEYNRIKELGDLVKYHSKLMSYYGFDVTTGKWNTRQFPIIQAYSQMEGINSDIDRYNKALREYNKYAEHLAKEYCINISNEMKKGHGVIFRQPPPQTTADLSSPTLTAGATE